MSSPIPDASQSARAGSRADARDLLAQPGDRGGQDRHHHRRARRLRSVRRVALPRQARGLCRVPLGASAATTTRPASSPRIPPRCERRELALVVARQFGAPGIGERTERRLPAGARRHGVRRRSVRGIRARPRVPASAARDRASACRQNFRLENTKEAVLAAAGEDTAMRFDGVTVDADTAPGDLSRLGLDQRAGRGLDQARRRSTACRPRPPRRRPATGCSASARSASAAACTG